MNEAILKAIKDPTIFEVVLEREFITDSGIQLLAAHCPNLESLTMDLPGDEALKYLVLFPNLKKLFINETAALERLGSWLESISSITQLTHLAIKFYRDLDFTCLQELCKLKELVYLDLAYVERIYDEDVKIFSNFQHLRFLNLTRPEFITDEGMPDLASLVNLEGLEFAFARVGNQGLKLLSHLKKLKYLGLRGTQISDEGLASFSFPHLEMLNLNQCKHFTDQGLFHLKNLPKLRQIYLGDSSQITKNAIEKISSSFQVICGTDVEIWKLWNESIKIYQ